MFRFRYLCLLIPFAAALSGQELDIGVQGGTPFGDFFLPGVSASLTTFLAYRSKPVPYTVGPTAQFGLPHRLGLEASALYQRFHYSSSGHILYIAPSETDVWAKTTGNAWSYPILLKWRPLPRWPAQVIGGPVVRHLGNLHEAVNYRTYDMTGPVFRREASDDPRDLKKKWYPGLVVGGGWSFQFSKIRISPEVRYTRWTANIANDQAPLRFPANQIELLVGITCRIF